MTIYQFVLGMVLAIYVGFSRLNHMRFLAREPMLTGILKVSGLPPQSTFWRFLASLNLNLAGQLLQVQRIMRQRVWDAAHVRLKSVTLDTDTTVHTLYGQQMGARKGYNPKNKGKKSYQPMLTFMAETQEYVWGELRNGDRPDGKQIARHLQSVFAALPPAFRRSSPRADSGFYCWEAVQAYEKAKAHFIMVARKTSRLVERLRAAEWKRSPKTDAEGQCEFRYQPEGWGRAYRFLALRYKKQAEAPSRARAISTLRHPGVYLSGVRHRHGPGPGSAGVVLQPAGWGGEPDQGSQQRRRLGGASFRALGEQLRTFSAGDAGLQPELLADAVPAGRGSGSGRTGAYPAGHGAVAFSVCGRQDLAARRAGGRQLQRPICGARNVSAVDETTPCDRDGAGRFLAGARHAAVRLNRA